MKFFCVLFIALLILGELLALPQEVDEDVDNRHGQSALKTIRGFLQDLFQFPVRRGNSISIQSEREISAIIVTDDYLCYKEPKSP